MKSVILGSTSKYRKKLLESTGLKFVCLAPQVSEKQIIGKDAKETALWRAKAKAIAIAKQYTLHESIIIGADQTLGFENAIIDKVECVEQARAKLHLLSGKKHYLHSAVVLARWDQTNQKTEILKEFVVDVPMLMRQLTEAEIEAYLHTQEWQGCAGCYQIENMGINLFEDIGGDSSSIIGLPLIPLLSALRQLGVKVLG